MKNKSLMNFYIIRSYRFNILLSDYTLKGINTRINYHSINKLKDKNRSKIFTDIVKVDTEYKIRLGFFILPVFDNGNKKVDNYKKIYEAIKILGGVAEKQKMKTLLNNNNDGIYTFFLRQYIWEPGFVESNFNVLRNSHIYNRLEGCFWMMNGFYNYDYLSNYIDANFYCSPNDYKLQTFEDIKTSSIISRTDPQNSLNIIEGKTHSVYISSNFFIDEKYQGEANNFLNLQNLIVFSLLNYTVLKIALEVFEFDTNEQKLN
ncbi:hypothetical protein COBT_002455 [Conglomerata obtusa]